MDNIIIEKLSKEQENSILTSVGYTRDQLKADVKHIREWLEQQHHLPASRNKESDAFLEWYLTGCKGSLETVKKKLDNYYTIRSFSELFENRDPLLPDYLIVRNMITAAIMPQAGYNSDRLLILRFEEFDSEKFDFVNFGKTITNASELYSRLAGVNSRLYIMIDCRGIPSSVLLKVSPSITRDLLFLWLEALAHRFLRVNFIYAPSYIETFINNIIKPLLPKKLQERFHFTTGGDVDVYNYFSPSIITSDYGGDSLNASLKYYNDLSVKHEQDHRDWFLNELSERTDESKRITTDNTPKNPYFGVHGSIKKLVID